MTMVDTSDPMQFLVVPPSRPTHWSQLIDGLPVGCQDIYYRYEYVRAAAIPEKGVPFLAALVGADGEGLVVLPFILRNLPDNLMQRVDLPDDWFDITSPYGYGGPTGPAVAAQRDDLLVEFDERFRQHCESERIVTEIRRCHPLLGNHDLPVTGEAWYTERGDIVWVDLSSDRDDLLRDLRKGHRSTVKQAMREGVTVRIATSETDWETFRELYYDTMQRVGVHDYYFFSEDYFRALREMEGDGVTLMVAEHGGEIHSASIFMSGGRLAHYHLSASSMTARELGSNNLLIYEAIRWAKAQGFERMLLGGGASSAEDDGVLRFKKGFSQRLTGFCTLQRVVSPEVYSVLCEAHGVVPGRDGAFFPSYRSR